MFQDMFVHTSGCVFENDVIGVLHFWIRLHQDRSEIQNCHDAPSTRLTIRCRFFVISLHVLNSRS